MADDPHNTSDISDPVEASSPREDSDTKTARRELKQASISEKQPQPAGSQQSQEDKSGSDDDKAKDGASQRRSTPEPAARLAAPHDDEIREQVSSPKKKRAHEELDEHRDSDAPTADGEAADKASNGSAAMSRTDRSEPEKKRARDHEGDKTPKDGTEDETAASVLDSEAKSTTAETSIEKAKEAETEGNQAQTSTAFTQSGFAKHAASSQSPFGALGSSNKPALFGSSSGGGSSPFGSATSSKAASAPKLDFSSSSGTSPFGAVGASEPREPAAAPKLSFAPASSSSPFATVALNGKPSGFGSGSTLGGTGSFAGGKSFGTGFAAGTALGGPRLTSFASSRGEALKSEKPAKPFGAPESDVEDSGDDEEEVEEEGENGAADPADEHAEDKDKEEPKQVVDDKKKIRLQKVEVDDGESGEVTILAVRAKMFQMEKGEGWKERGAGMLKVNVPKATVDINEQGYADMASFDASVLEDNDTSRVRLILRQDHTLRVILNSPIVPAMKFQLNQKLKAAFVLFTAFESNEAKQVQMKMSETNATNFTQLMDLLQKQLADV